MSHFLHENIGLIFNRNIRGDIPRHFFVAKHVAMKELISSKDNCYVAPLFLFNEHQLIKTNGGEPNFNREILDWQKKILGESPPHSYSVLYYAYALLYSPRYRTLYEKLLQTDFPRLPLTSNLNLFCELAKLGGELVALHLMEFDFVGATRRVAQEGRGTASPLQKTYTPLTTFINPVSPVVEKVSYSDNTVWIDKAATQGFHGVPENVWNFHIGGYQVCQKWLKDRKGRTLFADDINHYHRIVVALNETVRIMTEIDKVIEQHGGWPGAFQDKKEYTVQQEPLQKVAEEKEEYERAGTDNSDIKKDSGQAGMSAPESVRGRRGGSPLQAYALRPVTERNCVTAKWGGEQREVKSQSVG